MGGDPGDRFFAKRHRIPGVVKLGREREAVDGVVDHSQELLRHKT
jgi:hypothetical protein